TQCVPPPAGSCGGFNASPGQISGDGVTMEQFALRLSSSTGRTVIDKTGVKGLYDLKLEWEADPPIGPSPDGQTRQSMPFAGVGIFSAIQDQLDLKLESDKGFVETFVIDRAERPTQN